MNFLIVGLGNIGAQYDKTKHNVGFICIDELANKWNVSFSFEPKFKGSLATYNINGNKVFLLKPSTYMNLSGDSAILVKNYFKIDLENILVIHDDLDLEVGYLRLRENGSSGGHNGIKSMIQQLGSQEFKRARVGISKNSNMDTADYVLSKFSQEEYIKILETSTTITKVVEEFVSGNSFNKIMATYNKKKKSE